MTAHYEQAPLTLEDQGREVATKLAQHEVQGLGLAREVYAVHQRWTRETPPGRPGFKSWLSGLHPGLPEGSVSWYLDRGRADHAQIVNIQTPSVGFAAGTLLRLGTPASEVQAAVNDGSVHERAQAARSGGTVAVPVPVETQLKLKILRDELRAALNGELPEMAVLCVDFATENARQFGAWIKQREGT